MFLEKVSEILSQIKQSRQTGGGIGIHEIEACGKCTFCIISEKVELAKKLFYKNVFEMNLKVKIKHLCLYGKFENIREYRLEAAHENETKTAVPSCHEAIS